MKSMSLKTITTAAALSAGLLLTPNAYSAVDMFLDVPTIPGESADDKHRNEIDVLAWSWGLSQNSEKKNAGPGACVQDLSVTHYADSASAGLMMALTLNQNLGSVKLTIRKAGRLEYMVIRFQDTVVTSVSTGGSGGEDRLTENFTLSFSTAQYLYRKQDSSGQVIEELTATINADKTGCD